MTTDADPVVSATVLLRPSPEAEGAPASGTGEMPASKRPSGPEAAAAAPGFFAASGFEVGPVVAGSFSITGRRSLFETAFGEPLEEERRGGGRSYRTARGTLELDLARLPEHVARQVEAVAFSRPPDFGPTSFG